MPIEKPILPPPGPRAVLRDLSGTLIGNGVVAFIFATTGPVAIILSVGLAGGLSESDLASWIFGSFFLNGLLSIAYCLLYREPLVFFWTIPGTVLVGPALGHLTFPEVIGAFIATGVLMLVLGLSGWVRRAMNAVPMPIVMAMVAGVFLRFGLEWVLAFEDGFWIAAPMTAAFLGLTAVPALARRVPPLIAALVVGIAAIMALDAYAPPPGGTFVLGLPNLYTPVFSVQAMIELVIPLAITVLVVQNGQGFAILTAAGHKPPINSVTAACGGASIVTAFVGTVSTCLTGPVNAIIASSGDKRTHYAAGVLVAVLALVFGALAPVFTRLMLATPNAFIATLAGLAMLRVLQTAFTTAFAGRFALGALITFLITVADVSIFNIGAPFWGLVLGYCTSRLLEREAFGEPAESP